MPRSQAPILGWGHGLNRIRLLYTALVVAQVVTVSLYELNRLPKEIAVSAGLVTSLGGPLLSFLLSIDVFRHRRSSRVLNVASVIASYGVTCTSFSIIYLVISGVDPSAFNQSPGPQRVLSFGDALYFSIVTITTTGYGDVAPASGLARAAACWEIITGLLYQLFIFSFIASLISSPPAPYAPSASTTGEVRSAETGDPESLRPGAAGQSAA